MSREWEEYAKEIVEVLGLTGSPIGVRYSWEAPAGGEVGKYRVCDAFLKARDGYVIDITKETSACPGGTTQLGLAEPPSGEKAKALQDFLVKGEKLFCSIAAFYRSGNLTSRAPLGLAPHVVFSPLEKAEQAPDLVIFVCNPEQACRLVTLDLYGTGIPPKIEMAGATCHQAVTYPLVTGELNVSLMDYTSRRIRGYTSSDLLVTIPYHRFHGVMRGVANCTAGHAKMEVPEAFREVIGNEG